MLVLANAAVDRPLEDAFAVVPRENFLGEGQWRIMTPWSPYTVLQERDPSLIYQDVVVALDEDRGINNGSPALHAHWMHVAAPRPGERVAHVGAGAGYYSAILAELVGEKGHVTAIEYDVARAASARENLKNRLNVEVVQADGRNWPREPADVVYVNFAVIEPAGAWIEKLAVGGRLIFPLGVLREGPGIAHGLNALPVLVERRHRGYAATPLARVSFVYADGDTQRSDKHVGALKGLLERGGWDKIRSLVWNEPIDDAKCWFKGDGWALSYDAPPD